MFSVFFLVFGGVFMCGCVTLFRVLMDWGVGGLVAGRWVVMAGVLMVKELDQCGGCGRLVVSGLFWSVLLFQEFVDVVE